MKIELSSERRGMLLFLSFNMATVTSCANALYCMVTIVNLTYVPMNESRK